MVAPSDFSSPAESAAMALAAPVITVSFDVRPASCPNPLNPKSRGVLPVAILGTAEFDVLDIDTSSILLSGVSPLRSHISDVATAPIPAPQIPNLEVVTFTGPATGSLGGVVGSSITLRIANTGTADVTTGFPVGFYVSSDPVITRADRLLIGGREFVPSIAAGTERAVPLFGGASIAPDSPVGDVYLGVIVDEFDSIAEGDETDNTAHSAIRIDPQATYPTELLVDMQISTAAVTPPDECECNAEGADDFDDLTLKFRTQELVTALGSLTRGDMVELTITGQLLDGNEFTGVDCVLIVGGGEPVGDKKLDVDWR